MELSKLCQNIVVEKLEIGEGDSIELRLNLWAITPAYYDAIGKRLAPLSVRLEALREKWDLILESKRKATVGAGENAADTGQKNGRRRKAGVARLPSQLEVEKERDEIEREVCAEKLSCPIPLYEPATAKTTSVLTAWDVVEDGKPLAPTKENLMRLPPAAVREIWERFTVRAAQRNGDEDLAG